MIKEGSFTPSDEEGAAHAPRGGRHTMLIAGRIRILDSQTWEKALYRNLSQNGMRADCTHSWTTGTPVICELRGIGKVAARIVWVKGKSIGLRFNKTIDPKLVLEAPKDTGQTAHLARYLNLRPASHSRPAIALRSRHSRPPRQT